MFVPLIINDKTIIDSMRIVYTMVYGIKEL